MVQKLIMFRNILLGKNFSTNILAYNISYKTPTDPKPLCIRFRKIDGCITVLHGKINHLTFKLNID